jgi:hypothetical protein
MAKLGIPAALVVMGALSLGGPAGAAPLTSLSAAANPTTQQSDVVQVRYGGWHGHGGWHGGGFPAAAFAGALIGGAMAAAPYSDGGYYPYYEDYSYAAVPYYRDPAPYYGTRPGYYYGCRPHCGWGG